jgi:cytoplasmic iron level regulating protein YaaA (DUF328/UPF0246 family)
MKIVISPTKSLNFETGITLKYTDPFLKIKTDSKSTKQKSQRPIRCGYFSKINARLATCTDWKTPFTPENARPTIYAFDGDVYTGVDAYSIL